MRRTPIHVLLLFAAMAAALTGCSQLPTAPRSETAAAAATAAAPGSAPMAIGQVDEPVPPGSPGGGGSGVVTLAVGAGGSVQAGLFKLVIAKNSLQRPATIS